MIDWTNPNQIGALIGVVGGLIGASMGVWGACLGVFAPKGLYRKPIISMGYVFLALSLGGVGAGVALLMNAAPINLWLLTLLLSANMTIMIAIFIPVAKKRYAQAEERLMSAESLRRE